MKRERARDVSDRPRRMLCEMMRDASIFFDRRFRPLQAASPRPIVSL